MNKETALRQTRLQDPRLARLKSHWVDSRTILWKVEGSPFFQYSLYFSPTASLEVTPEGILCGREIKLDYVPTGASPKIRSKFPHLANYTALKIPEGSLKRIQNALKGQMVIAVKNGAGHLLEVSGIQIPGVLDELYPCTETLGVSCDGQNPILKIWAPSARMVKLVLFPNSCTSSGEKLPMKWNAETGVWSIRGDESWQWKYYLYEVEVFVPSTGRFEKNLVTDPYSLSLSTNSRRSQIVNLEDPSLKPPGWDSLSKPALESLKDIVIYEMHIRDFSAFDESVPANFRGTYQAFTISDSDGMKHLRKLAKSGLTHLHLLPVFDFASVNDDKTTWKMLKASEMAKFPPNSDQQQQILNANQAYLPYNWGYDPFHFNTPEGSYATNPDGAVRITEFRQMVQALNQNGLRVVMDMVFNHTMASGLEEKSVLDKVVPGYYHRLDAEGQVERSSCCSNTASEHTMMLKLIIDSLLIWAKEYKVDGFRFDLMGHHMLEDMRAVRAALDSLTL